MGEKSWSDFSLLGQSLLILKLYPHNILIGPQTFCILRVSIIQTMY